MFHPIFPEGYHLVTGQFAAFLAQVIRFGFGIVKFGSCRVERNGNLFTCLIAGFFDGFQNHFYGFDIGLQRGGVTAFVTHQGRVSAAFEDGFESMVNFGSPAQPLGEGGRTQRHDHKFLGVRGLPGGMGAAVEDVHHWNGQYMGIDAADIAVERQAKGVGGCFGDGQASPQDGIGAQFGFVLRAVQLQQRHVERFLLNRIPADQGICDFFVYVLHCFENAFSVIAGVIPVTHFQRLVSARGGA